MVTYENTFPVSMYPSELESRDAEALRRQELGRKLSRPLGIATMDQLAVDASVVATLGFANTTEVTAPESLDTYTQMNEAYSKPDSIDRAIGAKALSTLVQKDTRLPYNTQMITGYAQAA